MATTAHSHLLSHIATTAHRLGGSFPQVFDDKRQFAEWFDSMLEAEEGDDDDDGMGGPQNEVRTKSRNAQLWGGDPGLFHSCGVAMRACFTAGMAKCAYFTAGVAENTC